MALENIPLFNAMNENEVVPPCPPPHRKPFTPMESHLEIIQRVNACIDSVNRFETRMKHEMDSFMSNMKVNNEGFKNAIQESYNTFMELVRNEVNAFESEMKNSNLLFTNDISGRINLFETSINKIVEQYRLQVIETMNNYLTQTENHMEEQDTKIEEYRKYMVDNLVNSLSIVFDNKVKNGEISELLTQIFGETSVFKGSKTYEEIQAISNATVGDLYYCSTNEHYYKYSPSGWVDVGNGDKIYNDYETYKLNNDSFLYDLTTENTPFKVLRTISERMYNGTSGIEYYNKFINPTSKLIDNTYHKNNKVDTGGSMFAVVNELLEPISSTEKDNVFYISVYSSQETHGYFRLTEFFHWGGGTQSTISANIKKGFNLIKYEVPRREEGNNFNFFSFQCVDLPYIETLEISCIYNPFIFIKTEEEYSKLSSLICQNFVKNNSMTPYFANCDGDFIFNNNYHYKLTVNEKTTEEGEWRFACCSICLGKKEDYKGRKFLVKHNVTENYNNVYFGFSQSGNAWKNFRNFNANEIPKVIDFDYLTDVSTYKDYDGYIYIIFGVQITPYNATENYNKAIEENFYLLEITNHDNFFPINRILEFDDSKYMKASEFEEKIICWGDSLTAQGGWTSKLQNLSGKTVVNCGTGGEGTNTIMARQGANVMVVKDLTIPNDLTPVQIATYGEGISTFFGNIAKPLLQGGGTHVNPCKIGDIEGILTWTGSSYNDTTGTWTFTRKEEGETVNIVKPTPIITYADRTYNKDNIHLFFVGTNDGVFDVDELIHKIDLMIEHCQSKKYLVMGITRALTLEHITEYKEKMKSKYGRKFLDLHEYLMNYGLSDLGMTPTESDLTDIDNGKIPTSLTTDGVHYTEKTRELIGIEVDKRLREINYY